MLNALTLNQSSQLPYFILLYLLFTTIICIDCKLRFYSIKKKQFCFRRRSIYSMWMCSVWMFNVKLKLHHESTNFNGSKFCIQSHKRTFLILLWIWPIIGARLLNNASELQCCLIEIFRKTAFADRLLKTVVLRITWWYRFSRTEKPRKLRWLIKMTMWLYDYVYEYNPITYVCVWPT